MEKNEKVMCPCQISNMVQSPEKTGRIQHSGTHPDYKYMGLLVQIEREALFVEKR